MYFFTLNLCIPRVMAEILPSGNFIILIILTIVPIGYKSSSVGFSRLENF